MLTYLVDENGRVVVRSVGSTHLCPRTTIDIFYVLCLLNNRNTAYPVCSVDSGVLSDIERRIDRREFVHRSLFAVGIWSLRTCVRYRLYRLPSRRQPASSDRRLWRQFTDSTAVCDFPVRYGVICQGIGGVVVSRSLWFQIFVFLRLRVPRSAEVSNNKRLVLNHASI